MHADGAKGAATREGPPIGLEGLLQLVTLRIGENWFALDIRSIEDVDLSAEPEGDAVDLRRWFTGGRVGCGRPGDDGRRVITLLSWGRRARFIVDEVDRVVTVPRGELCAPEAGTDSAVSHTALFEGGALQVLSADTLVSRAALWRAGHDANDANDEEGGSCGCF